MAERIISMTTEQFIRELESLEQTMQYALDLFSSSFSLTSEDIKSLNDIELERAYIAATYWASFDIVSINLEYYNLLKDLERACMETAATFDFDCANKYKEAMSRLKNFKPFLEKIVRLFNLLPELVVERRKRNQSFDMEYKI